MKNRIANDIAYRPEIWPSHSGNSKPTVIDVEQLTQGLNPTLDRALASVENTIRRRPVFSLVVGTIVGVTLGCLIKRR